MISSDIISGIKAIVLDVDGVLTDGRGGYGAAEEIKFFHFRDGHWMRMAMRVGLEVGILSGRSSSANRKRAEELQLSFCLENCKDKLESFERLLETRCLKAQECLYMGDDVIDMPVMRRAGIAIAVADAVPELDEVAAFRTRAPGGHGAVCEAIRWLLREQGKLDAVLERYRR